MNISEENLKKAVKAQIENFFLPESKDYFDVFVFKRGRGRPGLQGEYRAFLNQLNSQGRIDQTQVSLVNVPIRDVGQTRREIVFKRHHNPKAKPKPYKPPEDVQFSPGHHITFLLPRLVLNYRYKLVGWEFKKKMPTVTRLTEDLENTVELLFNRLQMLQALLLRAWSGSFIEDLIYCTNGPQSIAEFKYWYKIIFEEADDTIRKAWGSMIEFEKTFQPFQYKMLRSVRFIFQNFAVQLQTSLNQMDLIATLIDENRFSSIQYVHRKHAVFLKHFGCLQRTMGIPSQLAEFLVLRCDSKNKVVHFDNEFFEQIFRPLIQRGIRFNGHFCSYEYDSLVKCKEVFEEMDLVEDDRVIFEKSLKFIALRLPTRARPNQRIQLVNEDLAHSDDELCRPPPAKRQRTQ